MSTKVYEFNTSLTVIGLLLNVLSTLIGIVVLVIYKKYSFLSLNIGKLIFRLIISEIIVNILYFLGFFYFEAKWLN